MGVELDPQKIIANTNNLLKKASVKQLLLIYQVAYEIIKK